MPPTVNTTWLNKSVNKDRRVDHADQPIRITPADQVLVAFGLHETISPGYRNPRNTLKYNLPYGPKRGTRGSFNWMIGYDAVAYHYVLEDDWIAWHAGDSAWRGYLDEGLSAVSIGVEWDLPGDGTPPTEPMWQTGLWLFDSLSQFWHIPLDIAHIWEHKTVALPPGRKHDPVGYSRDELLHRLHV